MSETQSAEQPYNGEILRQYRDGERPFDEAVITEMFNRLEHRVNQEAQHRIEQDKATRIGVRKYIDEHVLPAARAAADGGNHKKRATTEWLIERQEAAKQKGRGAALRLRLLILALDEAIDLSQYSAALAFAAQHYRDNPVPQQRPGWVPHRTRKMQEYIAKQVAYAACTPEAASE